MQVYSLPEDDDQAFFSCDISRQSDWLVVGQKDGSVVQLDPRGKYSAVVYWVRIQSYTELIPMGTKPNTLHYNAVLMCCLAHTC